MGCQCITDDTARSQKQVCCTCRNAAFVNHFKKHHARKRCYRSRLQDDTVSGCQCRSYLPCCHQEREVPRGNQCTDTDWFSLFHRPCFSKTVVCRNDSSRRFGNEPCIIPENICGVCHVKFCFCQRFPLIGGITERKFCGPFLNLISNFI